MAATSRKRARDVPEPTAATTDKPKVFNDAVLGHVELHPCCVAVVDTAEFPAPARFEAARTDGMRVSGRGHTRFAHSLGVSFLAGKLVEKLSHQVSPPLHITEREILMREISGSMSRSRTWPPVAYLREVRKDAAAFFEMAPRAHWAALFAKVVQEQKVAAVFGRYELTSDDVHFVRSSFSDKSDALAIGSGGACPANIFCLRSSRTIGMGLTWTSSTTSGGTPSTSTSPCPSIRSVDHVRARFRTHRGVYTVAYPEKEVWNVYELFRTDSTYTSEPINIACRALLKVGCATCC